MSGCGQEISHQCSSYNSSRRELPGYNCTGIHSLFGPRLQRVETALSKAPRWRPRARDRRENLTACRPWARTKVLARKREQRPPCGATASLGEKGQHPISRGRLGTRVDSIAHNPDFALDEGGASKYPTIAAAIATYESALSDWKEVCEKRAARDKNKYHTVRGGYLTEFYPKSVPLPEPESLPATDAILNGTCKSTYPRPRALAAIKHCVL